MAKLTQKMKDLISVQQCFVATVNPGGTPNLGPTWSTRVLELSRPLALEHDQIYIARRAGRASNRSAAGSDFFDLTPA